MQQANAQEPAKKPNVLFIAVDDLRPALGCYGNPIVKTPNLDKLAKSAVLFRNAYCQFPLCNPSRTSMLTGKHPTTTKITDNSKHFRDAFPDWVTLPELFRLAGYSTVRVGKIFHGGLDDEKSWVEGAEPRKERKPQDQKKYAQQSDRWVAFEENAESLLDTKTTERAIALLEKHKDKPFFLAVGYARPHSPLIAPKKYFDLYDPSNIPLPVDFAAKPTVRPGVPEIALPARNSDLFISRDASEKEAREYIAAYYACVSYMDAEVGRLLDALDRLGLRDNTIIVFFGDHGYHLGEKGKWSKHGSLYEVALRVPLLISAPGRQLPSPQGRGAGGEGGQPCNRPVQLLDIYPTLVELGGFPVPKALEGKSLAPLLREPAAGWHHAAFSLAQRGKVLGRSVRTERFRYTEWDAEGKLAELYDHVADPHELRNLAAEPMHAASVARLRKLLQERFSQE
ncbi:MAG: sulfatase [Gemmataceae bacterium]|nr:sulfatase [Gemmataceae bacterium]